MLSVEDRGEARRNGIDISRYRDTITTSDIEKSDGYYYNPSDSKMFRNFTAPYEVVNDANNKVKSITSVNEKEGTSTVSSMTLNFNSARAKDISDYLNAGRISSSQASALINENGISFDDL